MNFSPIQNQQITQKARNLAIEMDEPLIFYRGEFFFFKKKNPSLCHCSMDNLEFGPHQPTRLRSINKKQMR
jgi:hypothetical protein